MPTLPNTMKSVAFTALRQAQLVDRPADASPLQPDEVAGRTLVTLVSPGTEINWGFDQPHPAPVYPGYAAVLQIDALGEAIKDLQIGQHVFCMGNHAARQRPRHAGVVPLPPGLAPADAVHARLMGVSWTTLTTTRARPPARVLIMGLGIVGNLAAQIFAASGYDVVAIDPVESRRAAATRSGIADVRPRCPVDDPAFVDSIALGIDCSGHEQAVLDALRVVRKGGEVVLVGVPWKRRADIQSFDIMHAIFHRYVTLRSGWEWELPTQPQPFAPGNLIENWAAALAWIAAGRVNLAGLTQVAAPADAQRVYDDLLAQRGNFLSTVFDWSTL